MNLMILQKDAMYNLSYLIYLKNLLKMIYMINDNTQIAYMPWCSVSEC